MAAPTRPPISLVRGVRLRRDAGDRWRPLAPAAVRAKNAGRADCSEESYFAQLVEAYQLVTTKPRPDKLVVDCSRGIGAPKLAVLAERLVSY